jgi:hypothetical protein
VVVAAGAPQSAQNVVEVVGKRRTTSGLGLAVGWMLMTMTHHPAHVGQMRLTSMSRPLALAEPLLMMTHHPAEAITGMMNHVLVGLPNQLRSLDV